MFPLRLLLHRFVRRGHLRVIDHTGRVHEFGTQRLPPQLHDSPPRPHTLSAPGALSDAPCGTGIRRRHADRCRWAAVRLPQSPAHQRATGLPQRWRRVEATLRGARPALRRSSTCRGGRAAMCIITTITQRISIAASSTTTCNTHAPTSPTEELSLEEAQEAKKRHIAAKLDLRPGHRVLDIGCGFGGMACILARNYGVHVTGITLSTEQLKIARERAAKQGARASRRLQARGLPAHARTVRSHRLGRHVRARRAPALPALLLAPRHSCSPTTASRCCTRSGARRPRLRSTCGCARTSSRAPTCRALSQLAPVLEKQDYWLADFENLRLHYATTLKEWNRRFQLNRERVRQLDPARYDDRFCRMWEFYLQACEAAFRHSGLTVFQLQLTKKIDALPDHARLHVQRGAPADGWRGGRAGEAAHGRRVTDSRRFGRQANSFSAPVETLRCAYRGWADRVPPGDGREPKSALCLAHDRHSTPQAPRGGPRCRLARRSALPGGPAQSRGRAGAARRHPRQQRGARPRLRLPGAARTSTIRCTSRSTRRQPS